LAISAGRKRGRESLNRTVNAPQTADELEAIQAATRRGRPLGDPDWIDRTASALALAHTLRPRGRPRQKNTEK